MTLGNRGEVNGPLPHVLVSVGVIVLMDKTKSVEYLVYDGAFVHTSRLLQIDPVLTVSGTSEAEAWPRVKTATFSDINIKPVAVLNSSMTKPYVGFPLNIFHCSSD